MSFALMRLLLYGITAQFGDLLNVPFRCLTSIYDRGIGSLPTADLKSLQDSNLAHLFLAKISIYLW